MGIVIPMQRWELRPGNWSMKILAHEIATQTAPGADSGVLPVRLDAGPPKGGSHQRAGRERHQSDLLE